MEEQTNSINVGATSMGAADIAWVLTSTALVMLMVPALAFFYGGLVRRKNLVSTLVQCIIIFAVVSLVWFFWGYSFVYGKSLEGIIGFSPNLFGLNGLTVNTVNPAYAKDIPEILFFAFQLKFAAITPALIIGACAERIRFKSLLIFVILWSTLIYSPIAHWVWNTNGWLHVLGAFDFAGGIVVHIAAGLSALAAALVVGRRKGCVYWKDQLKALDQKGGKPASLATEFKPTNIPYVILGAGLLWFGWFGFNGGSALAADNVAVSAVVVTNLAAAAAAVSWMLMDWVIKGKPSAIGIAVGAVCGMAAITAASGYVSFMAAVIIGLVSGVVSNLVANWRAGRSRIDDTLDFFACHGIGGIIGAVAVGLFANALVNPAVQGLFYGNAALLGAQVLAVLVVSAFAFGGSYVLLRVVDLFSPLRVSPKEEEDGLDLSQHGEEAYHLE